MSRKRKVQVAIEERVGGIALRVELSSEYAFGFMGDLDEEIRGLYRLAREELARDRRNARRRKP